jgi:hypothetical protein
MVKVRNKENLQNSMKVFLRKANNITIGYRMIKNYSLILMNVKIVKSKIASYKI